MLGFFFLVIIGDNYDKLVSLLFGTTTCNGNIYAVAIYEVEVMIGLQLFTNMSVLFIIVYRRYFKCWVFLILTIYTKMKIIFHNYVSSIYLVVGRAPNVRKGSD